jgi:hypothetical protein
MSPLRVQGFAPMKKMRRFSMKATKNRIQWPSVLLGMALCLALVVFLGARQTGASDAQTGIVQKRVVASDAQAGLVKKMVTLEDVLAKCELIDQRILILEGKINVVQERCDQVHAMVERMSRGGK